MVRSRVFGGWLRLPIDKIRSELQLRGYFERYTGERGYGKKKKTTPSSQHSSQNEK